MVERRRRVVLLLAAVALVGPALAATSGQAGARAPASDWTEIVHGHPAGQDSYLYDSWSDGVNVWAAGTRRISVGGTYEWRTWVQKCAGSSCTLQNTRDVEAAPAYTFIEGVTGTSATDVWIAGYAKAPQSTTGTLVEHFDGATWSIVPTPIPNGGLWGISAASGSDVWAVGSDSSDFSDSPVALHWNGAAWSVDPVRLKGCRGSDPLWDVDATGRRPLAVGACVNSHGDEQAMIISRRAHGWHLDKITGIDPTTFDLKSVDWTGTTAWAGGSTTSGAVVLRLRHGTWKPVTVPTGPGGVYGFAGDNAKDVWAVGILGSYGWMTMHWDGTGWTLVEDPGSGWLESVTRTADGTPWAVGQKLGMSLIQRYDGALSP